jgi:hypothetical protein
MDVCLPVPLERIKKIYTQKYSIKNFIFESCRVRVFIGIIMNVGS